MQLQLVDYLKLLELTTPWVAPSAETENALEDVVQALLKNQNPDDFSTRYPVPADVGGQRKWVQAALTVRKPGHAVDEIRNATDRLLQLELLQKQITKASDLPRLSGSYPAAAHVSIWDGDISTLKVDAITNAANAQLLGCFQPFHACIDNVINCAAGPQLREDCYKIMQLQGCDEETGAAKITRAYNLPSKFVLHTVGPIVAHGHEPTASKAQQLASCYAECLSLAAELDLRSVALCGISTGVFGYPAKQAVTIALSSVAAWFEQNSGKLDHVVFNTFGADATALYKTAVDNWISQ